MAWAIRAIPTIRARLDGTEWLTGQVAAGGAGSSFRFLARLLDPVVVHRTANATLTSGDAFSIQTNVGATAVINFNLWSPTVGDRLSIVRRPAYAINLTPASGLALGDGAANEVLTILSGGRLNLRCYDAGHFVVESNSAEYDFL